MNSKLGKILLWLFGFSLAVRDAVRKLVHRHGRALATLGLIPAVIVVSLLPANISYAKELDSGNEGAAIQVRLFGVSEPSVVTDEYEDAATEGFSSSAAALQSVSVAGVSGKARVELPVREHAVKLVGDPNTNEGIMWDYLLDKGYTPEQAAGIVGNALKENGTLNPAKYGKNGFGIFQYTGGRRARLEASPGAMTLEGQLDYMMAELGAGYADLDAALRSATTIEEATKLFRDGYERPGVEDAYRRVELAKDSYARYIGTPEQV